MAGICAVAAAVWAAAAAWIVLGAWPASGTRGLSGHALASICVRLGETAPVSRVAALPWVQDAVASVRVPRWKGLGPAGRAGAATIALTVAAVLGGVLSASPLGAVALPCALAGWALRRGAKERGDRRSALESSMPDVFRMLSTALGSGCSLAQAIRYVGENADDLVAEAFLEAAFSLECGIATSDVLDGLQRRLQAPGLDLVTSALKISQRTGAPLKGLLEEASNVVAGRIELRRSLDVKTSQARLSAQVVALMPIAMLAFLAFASADFQRGLATPTGAASVLVALLLDAIAWVMIRRIMAVEL